MPSARTSGFRGVGLTIDVSSPSLENKAGNPAYGFWLILKDRAPRELDRIHVKTAATLTTVAKKNMTASLERPWESGSRTRWRLTGTLFGGHGHKRAVRGVALGKGMGRGKGSTKVGRGVGWPVLIDLERRARHWRSLEFGAPFTTIPRGVFVMGGKAQEAGPRQKNHVFMMMREFYKTKGLRGGVTRRKRSRVARARAAPPVTRVGGRGTLGGPIQPKFFLTDAWNEVVGPNGEHMAKEYRAMIDSSFGKFKAVRGSGG